MPLHATLIVLHASFATIAFGFGCALLAVLPATVRSPRFLAYFLSTLLAVALLITVVLVDWSGLPLVKRVAFGGLCILAVYLAVSNVQAMLALRGSRPGWRGRFASHVGFVLISLFDGFCIVSAIDLHLPPVVIALVAVLGVVAGILVIRLVARREARVDQMRQAN